MRKSRLSNKNPAAGLVAVYRAQYGRGLDEVLRVLRKAGLAAQPLDAPQHPNLTRYAWTVKVTVGVPPDEAKRAQEVLAEWDRKTAPQVAATVAELKTQLLLSLIPPAAVSLVLLLLASIVEGGVGGAWGFVPVVWLVGFCVISHVRRKGKEEE